MLDSDSRETKRKVEKIQKNCKALFHSPNCQVRKRRILAPGHPGYHLPIARSGPGRSGVPLVYGLANSTLKGSVNIFRELLYNCQLRQ